MEELAVYAGIARKDIDAAMDSLGARQGKLHLIKLCMYAEAAEEEVLDINKYDILDSGDASPTERTRGKKDGPRFGLKRVKDAFLGTTKEGRLRWSWKYTLE